MGYKRSLFLLVCLPCLFTLNLIPLKTLANPSEIPPSEFIILPLGLVVNQRTAISSALVRGFEDGNEAINFDHWLIRFSDVETILQLKITQENEQSWQITTPGLVTRINPQELSNDEELGLVISIGQIKEWFKVAIEFDLLQYAIAFTTPWSNQPTSTNNLTPPAISLEGLPSVSPSSFTLTAFGNQINLQGTNKDNIQTQGELTAIGTIFGGSWFMRTQQNDLLNSQTWRLQEAQWWYQGENNDLILGSQTPFWPKNTNNYWGFTAIERTGFKPFKSISGGFNPRQTYQPQQIERTIKGRAAPGTLVQLVRGFANQIVAEKLIDESGEYSFTVPVKRERYQIKLYRDGLLTSEPEIRDIEFTNIPELLTKGASAVTFSLGVQREFKNPNFIGEFTQLMGGVSYREGISEDLTLGVGFYHDSKALRVLGEIFYQPQQTALQLTLSTLSPSLNQDWEIQSRLFYNPTPKFSLNLNTDSFSQKFDLNWRISPQLNLTATANYSQLDPYLSTALQFFASKNQSSTYLRTEISSNNRLIWSLSQTFRNLRLDHRRSKTDNQWEISYNLSDQRSLFDGHSLILNYDTSKQQQEDYLAALGWRYRSPQRTMDGFPLWEFNLGYGIGSRGQGLVSSLSTVLIPGLSFRLGYQEISLFSDTPQFRIEIFPRLGLQNGLRTGPNPAEFERLRSEGGLWIKPFFDRNNNQKLDDNEEIFTQDANLLLILNNQPINEARPEIKSDGIFVTVPTGNHRLDLDAAGFPLDWTPQVSALAVKVAPGSYTEVFLPFTLSYTVGGIVTNEQGEPMNGVRVEATSEQGEKVFSVTNMAGVFYLESLKQGKYDLTLNRQPAQPAILIIDETSEPFQELNLILINNEKP